MIGSNVFICVRACLAVRILWFLVQVRLRPRSQVYNFYYNYNNLICLEICSGCVFGLYSNMLCIVRWAHTTCSNNEITNKERRRWKSWHSRIYNVRMLLITAHVCMFMCNHVICWMCVCCLQLMLFEHTHILCIGYACMRVKGLQLLSVCMCYELSVIERSIKWIWVSLCVCVFVSDP